MTLSLIEAEIIGSLAVRHDVDEASATLHYRSVLYEGFNEFLELFEPTELEQLMDDPEALAEELRSFRERLNRTLAESLSIPTTSMAIIVSQARRAVEASWAAADGDDDEAEAILAITRAAERASAVVATAEAEDVAATDVIAELESRGWATLAAVTRARLIPVSRPGRAAPARRPQLRSVPRSRRSRRGTSRRGPPARSRQDDDPEPPTSPPRGSG